MLMKKLGIFLFLICGAFIVGGCAKQGVVKSDETAVPASAGKNSAEQLKVAQFKTEKLNIERLEAASVKSASSGERPANRDSNAEAATLKPILNAGELKADLAAIYFDFDSYALSQNARRALAHNAEIMKKDPSITIRIEGNCDERGSDEYNLALGESRAKSAMKYLLAMGVPEKQLSIISYGKEKPFAAGHDEASWAKNRRDEFVITSK